MRATDLNTRWKLHASTCRCWHVQDTKKVLAEVREAKFRTQEQQEALTRLNSDLAAAKAETFDATQSMSELEQEAQLQQAQQQHLLDELSRSQVLCILPCLCTQTVNPR